MGKSEGTGLYLLCQRKAKSREDHGQVRSREFCSKVCAVNYDSVRRKSNANAWRRERTWKKWIKEWGFEKNVPESVKRTMVEKKKERTMTGKDTIFQWGCNEVPQKRLEQFENGQTESSMSTSAPKVGQ